MANQIILKGRHQRYEEAKAAGVITPGDLIMLNAAGEVLRQSSVGGEVMLAFAEGDFLQGRTIDDNYAAGEIVRHYLPKSGDEVYAFIAVGEDVSVGERLISAGGGSLAAATGADTGAGTVGIAVAMEALTGHVARTRIAVRIL